MNRGIFYAIGCYILWGLLPVYWKLLQHVPALEILAHRMVWAMVFVLLLMAARRRWAWLRTALTSWRLLALYTTSAVLLALNWYIYIWAVNDGHIVETSLGYFINPLVNVLLGVMFLRERLRVGQWASIATAAAGVGYLTYTFGALPWISLVLAGTFGIYALIRKTSTFESLEGLSLETMVLFPVALIYLLLLESNQQGAFAHATLPTTLLLAGAGVATATPLLLFAAAARRLTMTTLGLLQYLAPTLQLLLGIFVYGEELNAGRLVGFCLIWLALIMYSVEGFINARAAVPTPPSQSAAQ